VSAAVAERDVELASGDMPAIEGVDQQIQARCKDET
jgi:hypothetical protein